MTTLVLGSGGREHALAQALQRSPGAADGSVVMAPGNGGWPAAHRRSVDPCDPDAVVALCRAEGVDLVVIGPETVLAAGVSDALRAAGIAVFGPSRAAARLETSKAFCRDFAARHGIPSPASAAFSGPGAPAAARAWADAQPFEVVVKADGLAAGKGVVVPTTPAERDAAIDRLGATGAIVLEERLRGEEVSLLVFTDGTTIAPMPPARDHKRIGEADTGPNTGGMGVYAPTGACPPAMVERIVTELIRPAIDALRAAGTPYVGVLYAGVMLTADGPKLIEFNCRFGDPETQALLPLLATDLDTVVRACVDGRLAAIDIAWHEATTCTVVLAAQGYPDAPRTGDPVAGLDTAAAHPDAQVFAAGLERAADGTPVTAGGRVVAVTGTGRDLAEARRVAYAAAAAVTFPGQQMRRDIGWREIARSTGGYAASGVDIDEGVRAVALMRRKVEATHTPAVLGGVGAFGGALSVAALRDMAEPVLVASTDGVGTKVMVAAELGRYDTIGHDIVNHCVNDVLVQRAVPLFFLDYVAASRIDAATVAAIVGGMADACAASDCVLLGGETAEMPGVYAPGHFDIAGTMVGVVERSRLLPRRDVAPGDVFVGLASSGLHTNGYSLARRVFAALPHDATPEGFAHTLGEALLAPHRSYLPVLRAVLATDLVKALVHVTGGGFAENIPRVLPAGCGARVERGAWPRPPLFGLLAEASGLDDHELHRTFNMGIGMVVVVAPGDVAAVRELIPEPTWVIGSVTDGDGTVELA
jgi:phosphoribosylamine--glycine ligase/phosphoribosylaminoimidazole synthetase